MGEQNETANQDHKMANQSKMAQTRIVWLGPKPKTLRMLMQSLHSMDWAFLHARPH